MRRVHALMSVLNLQLEFVFEGINICLANGLKDLPIVLPMTNG